MLRQDELWAGVDRVVERAGSLADLRAHGLHLLAARRWRALRREIPPDLIDDEMRSGVRRAAVRVVLEAAREAIDGPIVVLKGPHTAAYYPAPYLRPYGDVDLLVSDPEQARRALVAAGFEPIGFADEYYVGLHHVRPLRGPADHPVIIELHRRPNWFRWSDPPLTEELLEVGVDDVVDVPGIRGLPVAHHALVLAAHAWVELPFRRLLDLVDVAAVSANHDRAEIDELARRWGMERVWRTTVTAADAMFLGRPVPWSLRIWGRNFATTRDRTVMETHTRRWLSTFWALPPLHASLAAGVNLMNAILPAPSDSWRTKLARSRLAIDNRSQPVSEHLLDLGADAKRAPRFRRR